ncbi:hypothetical protein WJX73_009632 [Symbiochloris irregularis]|uniref:EndoU domain-containing protein n=1 Tax=Symbiochloris irregularis TaxID=706552 RepID=A0AAW1PHN7_9CHLO
MGDQLSQACQRLWDSDHTRLTPGQDYAIDLQEGKRSSDNRDTASRPLFSFVSDSIWQRPTYRLFHALLDNYHREAGSAEHFTTQQQQEVDSFLTAVIDSAPMRFVHQELSRMDRANPDPHAFKQQLHQMWFSTYRRVVDNDSSGFEHVFVGETEEGHTKGFHNWVQFWLQERAGQVNYLGHLLPRRRGEGLEQTGPDERIVNIQFGWGGDIKPVSTMLVGTSPEFEMALYTLCFCAGQQENFVQLGPYHVKIRCYSIHSKYGNKIGSAFPELQSKTPGAHPPGGYVPAQPPGSQYPPQHAPAQQVDHQQPQSHAYGHPHSYAEAAGGQHQPQQQQQYSQGAYNQQQGQQQPYTQQPPYGYQQQQQQQQGLPADAAQQGCLGKLGSFLKSLLG